MKKQEIIKFVNRELEESVRESIGVYDRPITEEDLLKITTFDADVDWIPEEDINTISMFKNLRELDIAIGIENLSLLSSFEHLEDLCITAFAPGNAIDFNVFGPLKKLNSLFVSGGFYSSMVLENVEALITLENLESLSFHEFGTVDLKFLENMPNLKYFLCGWADEVKNIDSIGRMKGLESLELDCIKMDSIDFFDLLDDGVELDLCGLEIREQVDLSKFDRFKTKNLEEIDVCGVIQIM